MDYRLNLMRDKDFCRKPKAEGFQYSTKLCHKNIKRLYSLWKKTTAENIKIIKKNQLLKANMKSKIVLTESLVGGVGAK